MLLYVFDLMGVAVFAVSGALAAGRKSLALFAVSGARIAEAAGHAPIIVVLLGTMTGVVGGVLRDVLGAEVPLILRRDVYATAAVAGVSVYLLLQSLGVPPLVASTVGMVSVVVLRLVAIVRGLGLPVAHRPRQPS